MKFLRLCAAASFLSAAVVHGEGSRAGAPSNLLNPNISVIGDFTGSAGPRGDGASGRFSLREAEVAFQANVDPYARADFFLSLPERGSLEVEEGYVTLLALPWGLQARGGRIKAAFGRMNTIHGHERPQVDSPFVLDRFLGEEGLRDTGAEVSRLFAPLGVFTEASYAVLNGLGEEEKSPGTADVALANPDGTPLLGADGNPVVRSVVLADDGTARPRTPRSFAHVARLRCYGDLTDAANLDVGLSGVLRQPIEEKQARMAALDVTFRWRPPRDVLYRGLVWRTEGMYSTRVLPAETDLTGARAAPRRKLDRRGAYSYVEAQPARRWRFGVRGDYSEDPEAKGAVLVRRDGSVRQVDKSIERGVSPYVTFTLTEFNRFRLEYQRKLAPSGDVENRGWLQWTVVLGPHGAHPF